MHRSLQVELLAILFTAIAAPLSAAELSFEADIRPILKARCWQCHGEETELKGGLDARLARFLKRGGDSGPAIVVGRHAESLMYQRVSAGEMPPGNKKLSAREIDLVARWIDQGAKTRRPEPQHLSAGDTFSVEEKSHWAFQPIRRPRVPAVKNGSGARSPIDAFVLEKLQAKGVGFGPPAGRATLARRVYFDLIGLPPSPQEIDEFVRDQSLDAYERLVDRLLASPHYGEHWGRHWLDVAGYADSEGYTPRDVERKWAYKYRDYVIRSLDGDKPWDQFLVEQLAGDELLTTPYANLSREQAECLIATGFLRMAPDGTADSVADAVLARNDVVAGTIKIVSTSVLGLTVGCAQCHPHRYDPISQVDYYRLRAIFEPALDCKNWRSPSQRLISLWTDGDRHKAAAVQAEMNEVTKQRLAELDSIVTTVFNREIAKLPAEIQLKARAARKTSPKKQTAEQKALLKQYPFLNVDRGTVYLYVDDRLTAFNKKWADRTEAVDKKRPAENYIDCLTEVPGQIPQTNVFARGDVHQPRQEVGPAELAILNSVEPVSFTGRPKRPTSCRRLVYARHLTNGRHPLVARVLVNRFWMHHFGRGLVGTPSDFGFLGERPTHPELLDWLASEFMRNGWRLKPLHRLIVTSAVYRQSSERRPEVDALDPDNRLLGRMPVQRLEAETIRDSILAASGCMTDTLYGPPVPVMPDEVGQIVVGVDTRDSAGRPSGKVVPLGSAEFRRSIYVEARRSMPLAMLQAFDEPVMTPNCERRASSTVSPQALFMMNSSFVEEQAVAMAARILKETPSADKSGFAAAWRLVFGVRPNDREVREGIAFLDRQSQVLASERSEKSARAKGHGPKPSALAQLCQALLISNGFLYVD
ncbi:MAG TPA: PSD1 and planctomycete cytochrome C domain-containing protein [Planctomycetaceae bacterium]|nr:PSD1 and planctomycete cytochrome C domain-containing protein [Planctomycetaceae bacterium]